MWLGGSSGRPSTIIAHEKIEIVHQLVHNPFNPVYDMDFSITDSGPVHYCKQGCQ